MKLSRILTCKLASAEVRNNVLFQKKKLVPSLVEDTDFLTYPGEFPRILLYPIEFSIDILYRGDFF